MDPAAALTLAEQIVTTLIQLAPAIEKGALDVAPYIQAIAGMLNGSNATQAQIDALLAQLQSDSATFQQPLPDDPSGATDV
jgi:hypothetical protein